VHEGKTLLYRASKLDCDVCPLKPQCCLKADIPAVAELIARTARWVHPDTFRALPVWAPHAARGQPLFDAGWSRRYPSRLRTGDVRACGPRQRS
jgi:hypothetical protein